MKEFLIGVDVGNGNTKGRDVVFPSNVTKLTTKPSIETNTVKYNGNYYAIGGQKLYISKDITQDENALVLTLAVIAHRIKQEGMRKGMISLAVGLPLSQMGARKDKLKAYYTSSRDIEFVFEGHVYSIYIKTVDVYPQGYAAVVDQLSNYGTMKLVIDVGSWTVDILPIVERIPDVARCKSLPIGTINLYQEINERLRQAMGDGLEQSIITEVLRGGKSSIPEEYSAVIEECANNYTANILNNIRALQYNLDVLDISVIGGGASIFKHFCRENVRNMVVTEDVCINAKGYELLLNSKYRGA